MSTPRCPATSPPHSARRHDRRRVALGALLTFAGVLALVALVGVLVRTGGATDGSNAMDAHVLEWMLDRRSAGLTTSMRALTTLGGSLVLVPLTVVAVVALATARRVRLACYLATVVGGASLLSSTTKTIVGRPRPPVGVHLAGAAGSAFPSGHATQAAATFVAVAIVVGVVATSRVVRVVLGVVLAAIVVGVGLSRLYLGVHWASDVVGGWLAGTAWALGAARAFRPLRPLRTDAARRSPPGPSEGRWRVSGDRASRR